MTRDEVLKKIKKQYSENFSHLCRDLFPTLLEEPDEFYNLIINSFEPNPFLYDDLVKSYFGIERFKNYIFSKKKPEEEKTKTKVESPAKLMKKAGYTLYECKGEMDIQRFRKYYRKDEELCTFDGHRLDRCYVFFAVKDNVDEIKRENFTSPKREDEYGTSVISIQFSRGDVNTLSIKNRYNHTVNNPDATFSNNLDNIIEGLTDSFREYNKFNFSHEKHDFELPNYVKAKDGKFYRYNFETNNVYYCPNNIIIDNFEVKRFEKEKYIVLDNYILDLQNKKLYSYDANYNYDTFPKTVGKIDKLVQTVDPETKKRKLIINDDIEIVLDKFNQIVGYKNTHLKEIEYSFLVKNIALEEILVPNVEIIKGDFLSSNLALKEINLPNVKKIGNYFLMSNRDLDIINIPNVEEIGNRFLSENRGLRSINLKNVKQIGNSFLKENSEIKEIDFPLLETVDEDFLYSDEALMSVNLPNLTDTGIDFLNGAKYLETLSLPNVECVSAGFLECNYYLQYLYLPKTEIFGNLSLRDNNRLKSLSLPKVKYIGDSVLENNRVLGELYLPNVEEIGDDFLADNQTLKCVSFSKVNRIGRGFMYHNTDISHVDLPNVKCIGDNFLNCNKELTEINLENVITIGCGFLEENENLTKVNLPKVRVIDSNFMACNKCLKSLSLPEIEKIGFSFLHNNTVLEELSLPVVKKIDNSFLTHNKSLKNIVLPNVEEIGKWFMEHGDIESLNIPNAKKFAEHGLENKKLRFFKLKDVLLINLYMSSNLNLKNINGFKVYNSSLIEKISEKVTKII